MPTGNKLPLAERRKSVTSDIGQRVKDRAKNEIRQRATAAAKKAVKSGVKNVARAATGGSSVAVEAVVAFLFSKTGKKLMLALLLAWVSIGFGIVLIVFSLFTSGTQHQFEANKAATVSSQAQAKSTPGIATGVNYQKLIAIESSTGIPWEIPLAIGYYETMGGQRVGNQGNACSPGVVAIPYCAPTGVQPPKAEKGTTGEYGLLTNNLGQLGLNKITAQNSLVAALAISKFLKSQLSNAHIPAKANILSGVFYNSKEQPTVTKTLDYKQYSYWMISAIGRLPIYNNTGRRDINIYNLSQEWAEGVPPYGNQVGFGGGGGGAISIGQVCSVGNVQSFTVAETTGTKVHIYRAQLANAAQIIQGVKAMKLTGREALHAEVLTAATAFAESNLFDLPNINIPASLHIVTLVELHGSGYNLTTHVPSSSTSLGILQQTNSYGSINNRLNVFWATKQFISRVTGTFPLWYNMPVGQVAVDIQQPGGLTTKKTQEIQARYVITVGDYIPVASAVIGTAAHIPCSTTAAGG
jgi:hypothetical protein